jgi:hypothetical protein
MAHAARAGKPRIEHLEVDGRLFTVTIETDGERYAGFCEEIPGCGSQGRSLEELRFELADAIHECLLTLAPGHDAAETPR